jgi:glycosyltransferase involved in cell wall biosynthesis
VEKLKLSLVIITLNEEKNIERCIRSVPMASDIVVVDSGSRDRTVEIARNLGARILVEAWRGFYKQKTRATALALQPWVLSLDADEALSETAQKRIVEIMNSKNLEDQDAYAFPRVTYHMGKWLRRGGMYPDYQARLFHKERAKWLDSSVHEKIIAKKIKKDSGDILHWSFDDIADQIATINRYSSLKAQDMFDKKEKFSYYKLMIKPIRKFIEIYFIKRGFMDGVAGFVVACVGAFSHCLRYAKLYELYRIKTPQK